MNELNNLIQLIHQPLYGSRDSARLTKFSFLISLTTNLHRNFLGIMGKPWNFKRGFPMQFQRGMLRIQQAA